VRELVYTIIPTGCLEATAVIDLFNNNCKDGEMESDLATRCEEFGGMMASAIIDSTIDEEDSKSFTLWKATVIDKVKTIAKSCHINPWHEILTDISQREKVAVQLVRVVSGKNRPRKLVLLNLWIESTKYHPKVKENKNSIKSIYQLVETLLSDVPGTLNFIPIGWLDTNGFENSVFINDLVFAGFLKDLLVGDIWNETQIVQSNILEVSESYSTSSHVSEVSYILFSPPFFS
jgi:hypothetical protein